MGDWLKNWCSGSSFSFTLPEHCDIKRAEPKGRDYGSLIVDCIRFCGAQELALEGPMNLRLHCSGVCFLT